MNTLIIFYVIGDFHSSQRHLIQADEYNKGPQLGLKHRPQCHLKGIVHPEMKVLSSFIVPNLCFCSQTVDASHWVP